MTADLQSDLLTIGEAAKLLKISTVTLGRWLKEGRLPAYRIGPRAVRIRRADLNALLTPHRGEVTTMKEQAATPTPLQVQTTIQPLTEEQIQRGWDAFKQSEALLQDMLARRGGVPFDESWPLIREAREEREQRL